MSNNIEDWHRFAIDRWEFDPAWIESGLVTEYIIKKVAESPIDEDDPHSEHWRWRVFNLILTSPHMDITGWNALHTLARFHEQDKQLSISMRIQMVKRQDCPHSIIVDALQSDCAPLRKAALKIEMKK